MYFRSILLPPLDYIRGHLLYHKDPFCTMPKRTSGGLIKYASRRVSKRLSRKYVGRRRTRRVRGRIQSNYSFHRWVTSLGGANVTGCTYDAGTSVVTTTASVLSPAFSLQFTLSDLPSVAEFTTLFDNYMITGVMLQIKMISNPDAAWTLNSNANNPTSANANNYYPTIWYVADNDDHNNVTLAQIKEYEKVRHKVLRPNSECNIMLRPTTLSQVYRSGVTSGYAENRKRQWLDLAQTDIVHYGIKIVFDMEGLTPSSTYLFKVNAKYFFKCKNVR